MSAARFAAPALVAFAVATMPALASEPTFSDAQRKEIETIVRGYLLSHPEVLE